MPQLLPRRDPTVSTRPVGTVYEQGAELVGRGMQDLGQGIQQAAGAAGQIFEHQADLDAAAEASTGEADLQKETTELLAAYKQTNGTHAFADGEDTKTFEAIEKIRERILGGMTPRARGTFEIRSRGRLEAYRADIAGHSQAQRTVARASAQGALMASSKEALPMNYANPAQREILLHAPEASLRALADTPEEGEVKVAAWRRDFHKDTVNLFLFKDKDPEAASEYYALHKDEFGSEGPQIEHDIKIAYNAKVVDDLSTKAVDKARLGDEDGWADPQVAIETANDIEDQQTRTETKQAIFDKLKVTEARKAQQINNTADGIFSAYLVSGASSMRRDKAKEIDWLKRRAPGEWRKIDMTIRSDSEYWRRLANGEGGETEQQRQNMLQFMDDLGTVRPEHYRNMSMEQLRSEQRHLLSPHDYERAGQMVIAAKQAANTKGAVDSSEFKTFVDALAARNGFVGNDYDKKNDRMLLGAKMKIWVDGEAAKGGPISQEAMRKEGERLAKDIKIKGSVWGYNEKKVFQMTPDDVPYLDPEQDPKQGLPAEAAPWDPSLEASMRAAYKRQGVENPSVEQLSKMYSRLTGNR